MRALLIVLLLGGCAYTRETTAVSPIGLDTYSVGASAGQYVGGSSEARSLAFRKASAFCTEEGRHIRVIGVEPAGIRTNVTFQCLTRGDARLQEPAGIGKGLSINLNSGS